jgi:hypothetical protein
MSMARTRKVALTALPAAKTALTAPRQPQQPRRLTMAIERENILPLLVTLVLGLSMAWAFLRPL